MKFLHVMREELEVDDAFRKTKMDRARQQSLRMKENLVITIASPSNKRSISNAASFNPGTKKVSKSSVDDTGKKQRFDATNVAEHIQNHVH